MRKFYFLFFLTFFYFSLQAQENPKIDKKSFFVSQDGLENAKKDFSKAEKYYRKGKGTYDEALKSYLKLSNYNDNSNALNYKIGICYLWTSNKKAALGYFLKSSPDIAEDYYLALGRAYQYNFEYAEAKTAYNNYIESLKDWRKREEQKKVDKLTAECENSLILMQDSMPVFIQNLGPLINSYYDDYGAYLPNFDSAIYFTSKRPVVEPKKRVSRFKFGEQLLSTNNCINEPAEYVAEVGSLTSLSNMGIAGVDKSEKKLYIYEGKWHNGSLNYIEYKKGRWRKLKPIKGGINHIAYKETCISIADDGTAYYITDRRGGEGGKDIWMAEPVGKNKLGNPKNMGDILNTPFEEATVYVTRDGNTLYFSSNGRLGMGGYDIFKTTRDTSGNWAIPVNMGHPINSPADELYYHPTSDTLVALYSTIREDSYGGLDIYKIQTDPSIPFKLIGEARDTETNEIIPATITVFDNSNDQILYNTALDTISGIFTIDFKDGGDFYIEIQCDEYRTEGMNISCPKEKYATTVLNFKLEKLKHPFSLMGSILDVDSQEPIRAALIFTDALSNDTIARTISNDSTGQYSITFSDKFDMIVNLEAEDYFSDNEPLNTTSETEKVITKDFTLKKSRIDYNLTGIVTNDDGTIPISATLSFYKPNETEPFNTISTDSTSGKYSVIVNFPGPFLVEVEASGYFFINETFQFSEGQTFTSKDYALKKLVTGAEIVVENILFKPGKAALQAKSFAELDKLAKLLLENPSIRIEVSGHTDNVGSASVNKKISKSRALTVKNYLVSRGVEDSMIEYVGQGFDFPIAPNDTEEGREKNRRVQVKVLN